MHKIYQDLLDNFPNLDIKQNFPLAPLTTLKIGGPADIFIQTKTNRQLIDLLKFIKKHTRKWPSTWRSEQFLSAQSSDFSRQRDESVSTTKIRSRAINDIPITILGNGSNVLISDSGIRGIVIKNTGNCIQILSTKPNPKQIKITTISAQRKEDEPQKYLNITPLHYNESDKPQIQVKLDAGIPLSLAITKLVKRGITGLQWFAYIPGTIGGAIWYNAHGGEYHISSFINSITVFDQELQQIKILDQKDIKWSYDSSTFQKNPNLIILSVTLNLYKGNTIKANNIIREWIAQKSKVQPLNSAGSTFKNPTLKQCLPIWGEQKSTGWIIDHKLNLKGTKIGATQISTKHANFIVNTGNATAKDYLDLVKLIQQKTKSKLNLDLNLEIKLLGNFT